MIQLQRSKTTVMPTYRRMCKFNVTMHLLIYVVIYFNVTFAFSLLSSILIAINLNNAIPKHGLRKRAIPGKSSKANVIFSFIVVHSLFAFVVATWLAVLLLCSGDVHPNPGPSSVSSTESLPSTASNLSSSILNSLTTGHNLSFVHYNVQSILNKLDILQAELSEFDILAFTETWLSPQTDTADLDLATYYRPERKDRDDGHGGVILYVKETLRYKRRADLELRDIECIWIELINNHQRILFGLFYRPPNSNVNYLSSIEDSLGLAIDTGIADIIVTGDFNLNMLNPNSARKVETLCTQFSFFQTIDQPTHFTETSSSLIDILLVTNKNNLLSSGVSDPFLDQPVRYHCPIFGIFKFSKHRCKSFTRHIWNYDQGDYNRMREKASAIPWEDLQHDDINVYADNILSTIDTIARECIPNRNVRIKVTDPPWITSTIKSLIRKRKRAYKKARRTNLIEHWQSFKRIRNKVISMVRKGKDSFYENLSDKLKSHKLCSKDWWSTIKHFINSNSTSNIPPLEYNNNVVSEDLAKANVLNTFFQSQTIMNENGVILPDIQPAQVDTELDKLVLTQQEVQSALEIIPLGKASGPNGLSNRILRELSAQVSAPYCSLFNQSLRLGVFPTSYKEANVCPVPKKGDLSLVTNYRPISLLNSESKLFERIVFKHLYNHLQRNNLLSSLQSGFIPGDSTVNQLTFLYNTFCQALDSGKEVRAVFCDISKAFDRVWHRGLIHKLRAAGVTGEVLAWFKNYLSNRKQRVVIPGATSDYVYIQAGVPQGSILGPLLFLLYINDIVNDIGANIRLFADDTSLYIIVENPATAALCLNNDLGKISRWASLWLVTFNPVKNETMLLTRKRNKLYHPPLFMQNHQVTEVESHKHLGIHFASDCTWHQHIDYIKQKAWLRRRARY